MKKNERNRLVNAAVFCARMAALTSLIVSQFFWAPQMVSAAPEPAFTVQPDHGWVGGGDWTADNTVTLIVDDTLIPSEPYLYTDSQTVASDGSFWFNVEPAIDLAPGQYITVDDTVTTKSTQIEEVYFDSANETADVAQGRGPADRPASVYIRTDVGEQAIDITIGSDGNWTADFSGLLEIQNIQDANVQVYDADGDGTMAHLRIPHLDVWYMEDNLSAYDWPVGTSLNLTIVNAPNPDYTATEVVGSDNTAYFNLSGLFDILPGMTVTVTDGAMTRELVVSNLVVTSANAATDTVSGTTEPNKNMWMWFEPSCCRGFQADGDGNWSVDYRVPGSNGEPIADLGPGSNGTINAQDEDGDNTSVSWNIPNPRIEAAPYSNWINARDWDLGVDVIMEIDDPADGTGDVDYTETQTVIQAPWNPGDPNDIAAFFEWPDSLTPGPDYIISMDGDGMNKTYTVADVRVTSMDAGTEQIAGVASPNANVQVCVNTPDNCIPRYLTADGLGNWTADYSVAGSQPDEVTYDLNPGDNGWAAENGEFGDQTWYDWNIPNPDIRVAPYSNWIEGREWALGVDVTMEIDDPADGTGDVDYTETQTVIQAPWNPGDPNDIAAFFEWPDSLTPGPDYIIHMDGDGMSKTYIVADVRVTSTDAATEQIAGVASPNANVQVCVNTPDNCIPRYLTADGLGNWTADYSVAGSQPDEVTYDLNPSDNGWAAENGEFGDQTLYDWNIPNPRIEVAPYSNWINAREWALGVDVIMEIDDPADGTGDVDYTETQTVIQAPWNPGDPNDVAAYFEWPDVLTPGAGYIIHMDGDGQTKTYTVADVRVTSMDADTDQISGVASPNANVQVCVNTPDNCIPRYLTADGLGNWTADYSVAGSQPDEVTYDLNPGDNGWAAESGEFGDQTWYDWNIPNPNIQVRANEDRVQGEQWPLGNTVTIDVSRTGENISDTAVVVLAPWDASRTFFEHNFAGAFDIQVGDLVSVTDGTTTRTTTVTGLSFTKIDLDADIVTGVATPDANVDVWICVGADCNYNRHVTADGTGVWEADFGNPGAQSDEQTTVDIVPGTWIDSIENDANGNGTMYGMDVSCHVLTLGHTGNGADPSASPANSSGCAAGEYVLGESITLSGATPDTGWDITGWTGTDDDSSLASTNSLVMPNADHTVTVIYADNTAPTVVSIAAADASPTNATSVDFTVTFSEPVTGVDMTGPDFDDFTLTTSDGISGASVTAVNGSGDTYTVTVNTGSGNGTLRLDAVPGGNIQDAVNNPLADGFTSGEVYGIIKTASFEDVPLSNWASRFIEQLYYNGITGGCSTSPLNYCPEATVTRAQMAVFLLVAEHGTGYTPPDAVGLFNDVPADNGFAKWIEQLAAEGITGGCGGGNYCPNTPVTREQMAVFLLVAKHGTGYTPPAASGVFADVPADYPFAPWIEALAAEGITGGCGGGNFCPKGTVTRAQMAVFLVTAFNLP